MSGIAGSCVGVSSQLYTKGTKLMSVLFLFLLLQFLLPQVEFIAQKLINSPKNTKFWNNTNVIIIISEFVVIVQPQRLIFNYILHQNMLMPKPRTSLPYDQTQMALSKQLLAESDSCSKDKQS